MRTLTLLAVAGVIVPSLLSLFQNSNRLTLIERVINALAKLVKVSLVLGFGLGALGLGSAIVYYGSPLFGLATNPETIEISVWALQYYALIGVVLPILGIVIGSMLTKRQELK
ncbi:MULTISPECIES: hypothetical protein [Flammeovirga]|uniref:Uncharacterized protein n=1 Tax=Flammeovirga agarivorans TaxID=2726742 RepID=A0A7X8XX35_9BACT|nr:MULTISPECIES: hypothetical protein [Flammeovirga]NLR92867.1 hypothetical protein [Flammeovirga agarivorans]